MSELLQRKPVALPAWHLDDQAAMLAALGDLMESGWRGAIAHNGTTWQIELNADNPSRHIIAVIGDWLVLDFELRKFTDAQISDNYESAEA